MAITFITERSESILNKAKFPSESYNVPNTHKCFDEVQVALWQQLTDVFGINLDETEYTVRASVRNGETALYTPYIGSDGTQAILVWGKVKKPLADLNKDLVELSIGGGKRPALECFIPALDDTLVLTMMFAKGDSENATKEHKEFSSVDSDGQKNLLRKALRTGKLHNYLSQSFEKAQKLATIAGSTVEVYGYTLNRFGKYELETSKGLIISNTAIAKKLDRSPVITKDTPATLEVGLSTSKTSTGYDIYPAILTTQADRELPVFDFGASEAEVDEYEFV